MVLNVIDLAVVVLKDRHPLCEGTSALRTIQRRNAIDVPRRYRRLPRHDGKAWMTTWVDHQMQHFLRKATA